MFIVKFLAPPWTLFSALLFYKNGICHLLGMRFQVSHFCFLNFYFFFHKMICNDRCESMSTKLKDSDILRSQIKIPGQPNHKLVGQVDGSEVGRRSGQLIHSRITQIQMPHMRQGTGSKLIP